jgi:hypothetical protein
MNAMPALHDRARRITVAVLVLLLLGTATAAAYWTATAQVTTATQAASMGLAQELRPGGQNASLVGPYTAQSSSRAGIVALTNTGSRDGTATLTLASRSGALEDSLPGAVRVSVGLITGDQQCTPQTVPSAPVTGTLASDVTLGKIPVGAGKTVLVCVQTSLSPDALTTHAGRTIDLALTSSLRYAAGERWTTTAGPLWIEQNVEKDRWADLPEVTYSESGSNLNLSWTRQGASTHYRLSIATPDAPRDRSPLRSSQELTGSSILLHHSNGADQAALKTYVHAAPGRLGSALIYIEESTGGNGPWTPVAVAEVRLYSQGNDIRITQR